MISTLVYTDRAGVIPYVMVNEHIYFLLGRDNKTKELTDFGGGVKITECTLMGAMREFREETNQIFDSTIYNLSQLTDFFVISDNKNMTIIFLPIDNKWLNIASNKFLKNKKHAPNKAYREIDSLIWLHENRFKQVLKHSSKTNKYYKQNIMWTKVQQFLLSYISDQFYALLKESAL